MQDVVRQVLVGILISAIGGVWLFAATRASNASVNIVREELKELEVQLEGDVERNRTNTDDIKDTFHRAMIEQAEFRAQVREKLDIQN